MGDLILGIGMIAAGTTGLIALGVLHHRWPKYAARLNRLRKRTDLQLHAELTRNVGNIADCVRRGDRKGMRRARRAMWPALYVMSERCKAAKKKTTHAAT